MEGVRCFLCANGNPVEPRLHYVQVMASHTALTHARASGPAAARTTDCCGLGANELTKRIASCAQERTLEGFLEAVGLKLGLQARRCFTRHGGEIEDVALVMHNEVLFLSAGEDFLPCRQGDAESLSYACQLMLEEELFHRRLVAQNQAAVSMALEPPAQAPREGSLLRWANETGHSRTRPHREQQPTSPDWQWDDAARPSENRFASSLGRTVSFGLSAVEGAVGEPDDRWGGQTVAAWTAAQIPAHLLEGEPPRSSRGQAGSRPNAQWSSELQPQPELEPEPEPEPEAELQPEPEAEPAADQSATGDSEAEEQEAILQLLLERETKLMRIYAFYVEHQPPEPKERPAPSHSYRSVNAGHPSPISQRSRKPRRVASPAGSRKPVGTMQKSTCIKVCSHFDLFPSLIARARLERLFDDITEVSRFQLTHAHTDTQTKRARARARESAAGERQRFHSNLC